MKPMAPSPRTSLPGASAVVRVFARLAAARDARLGAVAVAAASGLWALFCLLLARAGHAPSRVLVPLPRESYYLAQALFVLPLMLLSWLLCALVAVWVGRALGGSGRFRAALNTLGLSLALPLMALFLLPDMLAYAAFGFSALGPLVRVTAPLSFVATLALAALAMHVSHALPRGRAFAAGAAGVFAQAALGGLLLR
jgi:hypothetical protein